MNHKHPTALIILDGLGISCEKKYNAFYQAKTPYLDKWQTQHSYTTLQAAGKFVGLPETYHGNSEVGHFTIGAGAIIEQTSKRLNVDLQQKYLNNNPILINILKKFNPHDRIHLIGIASDGNIHGKIEHAKSFITTLAYHGFCNIFVHAFLDGRDCPPQSALDYLKEIEDLLLKLKCGKIVTIHGRFYAMDRNKNYHRTEQSFQVLTQQQIKIYPYTTAIKEYYKKEIFDEFIPPFACNADHTIQQGDGLIFFNFRPDRAIQITEQLLTIPLQFFITPILYHTTLPTTPLIQSIQTNNTLLEKLNAHNKTLFTIAETEKYAHVTYFFNGHKDITLKNETRILIPSLTLQPEEYPFMQAEKITNTILHSLNNNSKDFYLINYANADMVGHSGNLPATIQAIECLDDQLQQLYEKIVVEMNGTMYITADHGNAECMFDPIRNQRSTSHTSNPVPFYAMHKNKKFDLSSLQGLAQIAPYILKNMYF
jgi:2,3-bisphosphoglycerate-independent phosphoglycerate mutase